MWKKVGLGLLVVVLGLAVGVGALMYTVFGNNKPVEHGTSYARTTVVEDVAYVSMYLVDTGEGSFVLIDGGVDRKHEAASEVLAAKGASTSDLVAVLLTHAHADHIGAAYGLGDVPLYVHEDEVALTQGEVEAANAIGGFNDPGLKVDHTFKHGDVLEFGEAKIEVFHTPGHSPGNSAFLIDGVLLLGDTAQVLTDDQLTPPPWFFSDDPEQAIEAIRTLAQQIEARSDKPVRMVGSHSGSTENITALTGFAGAE